MASLRNQAAAEWGIDIAYFDSCKDGKLDSRGLLEDLSLVRKISLYRGYEGILKRLNEAAAGLADAELSAKVCEAGFEVCEMLESAKLWELGEIRKEAEDNLGEAAAQKARDAEASHLAGHLAIRTSVTRNRRLRKALDDLREHNKPASRERFEQLLRELYIVGPKVWNEHRGNVGGLSRTRTAAVKMIEQRLMAGSLPSTDAIELAQFAENEKLLQQAKNAGLAPREFELFALVMGDTKRFLRKGDLKLNHSEAAHAMGVATGTTKSLWSRIKKKIRAA